VRLPSALLAAAVALGPTVAAVAEEPVAVGSLRDRLLTDVLLLLRKTGLDILYSDELVRPEWRVGREPRSKTPRRILDEVLAPHGLEVKPGPEGRLLVVRARRGPRPSTVALADLPRGTELRFLVRGEEDAPLRGLAVSVPEHGPKRETAADGSIGVPVAPGLYRAEARLRGYRPWQLESVTAEAGRTVDVVLRLVRDDAATSSAGGSEELVLVVSPGARYEENVEVSAEPLADAGTPPLGVTPLEVSRTAGAFENVFRTLPLFPGVTPANEVQSRFSVRAGGPERNLTILDGVEVYNPFRLEAVVSAFNPETVESFDLTTGVLPARYGDRLSSAFDVRTRAGRRSSGVQGTAAAGLTDAGVVLEGPLPGTSQGTWLAAARRTYLDLVAQRFMGGDVPGFQDVQLRVDWPLSERARLSLSGLRGTESGRDVPLGGSSVWGPEGRRLSEVDRKLDLENRNEVWAARLEAEPVRRLFSTTVLSFYRNPQDLEELESLVPERPEFTPAYERRVAVEDLALRQTFHASVSKRQHWEAGVEVHGMRTRWAMRGAGTLAEWWLFRGSSLAPTPWGSRGPALAGSEIAVDSARRSTRWGAWAAGTLALSERVVLRPGIRLERSTTNGETSVLPRLGATWALSPATRLGASLGWHAQSPGFEKVLLADSFLDFGGSEALRLASERSRQVGLSLEHDLGAGLGARLELYDRRLDHLIVGRLESEEERRARLALYDRPPYAAGALPGEPLITAFPVNDGFGTSRGFEVSLVRRAATVSSGLSGALSYSYGFARQHSYGRVFPFDYDRQHAVTAAIDWQASRSFGASATWRGASGLPYTPFHPVVSLEPDRMDFDGDGDRSEYVPSGYAAAPGGLAEINSARHPFYSRLDLRARFTPPWGGRRWEFFLDVFNVLSYDVLDGNNGPSFKPSIQGETGNFQVALRGRRGPLVLPSFGVRVRF
jgi:hypothetical protein